VLAKLCFRIGAEEIVSGTEICIVEFVLQKKMFEKNDGFPCRRFDFYQIFD